MLALKTGLCSGKIYSEQQLTIVLTFEIQEIKEKLHYLTKVSASLMPMMSEMGETSNFAATRGRNDLQKTARVRTQH